jgi:hypothetical protein
MKVLLILARTMIGSMDGMNLPVVASTIVVGTEMPQVCAMPFSGTTPNNRARIGVMYRNLRNKAGTPAQ